MSRPLVVAVRFDKVLAVYDKNRGPEDIGRPITGAKEFMRWLIEDIKAIVIVETGRLKEELVRLWLVNNGIQFSKVNQNYDHESIFGNSKQVLADIYVGANYVNVQQGNLAGALKYLMPLIHQFREQGGADTTMDW